MVVDDFIEQMKLIIVPTHHNFVLYRDYYTHPRIDEILKAIHHYKMINFQQLMPFADALIKTDKRAIRPYWQLEFCERWGTKT